MPSPVFVLQPRLWEPLNFRFLHHRRKFICSHFAQDGFFLARTSALYPRGLYSLTSVILERFRAYVGPCPLNPSDILTALFACARIFCDKALFRQETGFNVYNKKTGQQVLRPQKFPLFLQKLALDVFDIIKKKDKSKLLVNIAKLEASELFLCAYNGFIAKLFWNIVLVWMCQPVAYIPLERTQDWQALLMDSNAKLLHDFF